MVLAAALALHADGAAQVPEPAARDVTVVPPEASDPLGWIGAHDVLFLARTRDDEAELRSGPDPNHRAVRRVPKGTLLLVVGDDGRGWFRVLVPSGYRAYVHGRYVDVDANGFGVVNADRVNVRSVPSSLGDYPIGQLDRGESLLVWRTAGTESEWLEVTPPGTLALWIADGTFDLVGEIDDARLAEIAAARAERLRAWEERTEEARLQAAERRSATDATAGLETVRVQVARERERGAAAEYAPARESLRTLRDRTTDPALLAAIDAQEREIGALEQATAAERARLELSQRLDAELERLERARKDAAEAREKARAGEPGPQVQPGQDVTWAGFLRVRPDDVQHPIALEQGSRVVVWLECSKGRYVLADFGGRQVQVAGRVSVVEGIPSIDVTHLEVLR